MSMVTPAPARFEFGRVFGQVFATLGRNPLVFGVIALLFIGVPYAVFGLVWPQATMAGFQSGTAGLMAIYERLGVMMVLISATGAVMQAAIIHGVAADQSGRPAGLAECLTAGLAQALPVVLVGFLLGLAILVGLILLIIPAIFVSLAFAVAVPVQVVEKPGIIDSFRRSYALTQNHWGTIFGINFVINLLVGVISLIVGAVIGAIIGIVAPGQLQLLANVVVSPITGSLGGLISAATAATIYFELRRTKEGVGVEQLASVFS